MEPDEKPEPGASPSPEPGVLIGAGGVRYRKKPDGTDEILPSASSTKSDAQVKAGLGYKAGTSAANKGDADITDEEIGKMSPVAAAGARARRERARKAKTAQGEGLERMATGKQ